MLAIIKCVPGDDEDARKARAKLLLNAQKQIKAEKGWELASPHDPGGKIAKIANAKRT
jgi:hypothetical protein